MSISTKSPSAKHKCGCGSEQCQGECKCHASVCRDCDEASLTRPLFFSGQLLTDEDLGALSKYIGDKNRLHNRHLFGAGVVCGLKVKLNPCKERTVVVEPGYALDCCGNDIVVPCQQDEVDIVNMIRELRTKMRNGFDCGDPCNPPGKNGNDGQREPVPQAPQSYYLYIKYHESKTDLVSPYEVDGGCASATCQATRVREGFEFELRCPQQPLAEPSVASAWARCIRQSSPYEQLVNATDRAVQSLDLAQKVFYQAPRILAALSQGEAEGESELKTGLEQIKAQFADLPIASETLMDEQQRQLITFASDALTLSYRLSFASSKTKEKLAKLGKQATSNVSKVMERLSKGPLADDFLPIVVRLHKRQTKLGNELTPEDANDYDVQCAVVGEPVDLATVNQALKVLTNSRPAIITCAAQTIGEVRTDLASARLTPLKAIDKEAIVQISMAASLFRRAIAEIYQQCLCDSLLPPCPPCNDLAVMLARIDVVGCKVVQICNLDRSYVLNGPALRYWFLPLFHRFWLQFEKFCCGPQGRQKEVEDPGQDLWTLPSPLPPAEQDTETHAAVVEGTQDLIESAREIWGYLSGTKDHQR